MERTRYWIKPSDRGWRVEREGAERAAVVCDSKEEAVQRGVEMARNQQPSQLLIQAADGTIAEERTYQNDPFPPRG